MDHSEIIITSNMKKICKENKKKKKITKNKKKVKATQKKKTKKDKNKGTSVFDYNDLSLRNHLQKKPKSKISKFKNFMFSPQPKSKTPQSRNILNNTFAQTSQKNSVMKKNKSIKNLHKFRASHNKRLRTSFQTNASTNSAFKRKKPANPKIGEERQNFKKAASKFNRLTTTKKNNNIHTQRNMSSFRKNFGDNGNPFNNFFESRKGSGLMSQSPRNLNRYPNMPYSDPCFGLKFAPGPGGCM